MNYLTIAFLLVIVVTVGIVAMTARIALSENSKVLNRIRDALQRVRLFKMLQKRNVDVQSYLRDTDVSKIRQQIAVCDSCPSVQSCETALESKDTVVNDFSFCPNNPAIEQLQSSAAPEQGKLPDPPGRSA
jgi:hypothetical protein